MSNKVYVFTDGACIGNPGPGGWSAIIRDGENEMTISGGDIHTTNNRMELTAVIMALKAIEGSKRDVVITTDSAYVVNAINQKWLLAWRKRGWRLKTGGAVKNSDLWDELSHLINIHNCSFVWVKGHNGHKENETCDRMATREASNLSYLAMAL